MVCNGEMVVVRLQSVCSAAEQCTHGVSVVTTSEEISIVADTKRQVRLNISNWDESLFSQGFIILQNLRIWRFLAEDILEISPCSSVHGSSKSSKVVESSLRKDLELIGGKVC